MGRYGEAVSPMRARAPFSSPITKFCDKGDTQQWKEGGEEEERREEEGRKERGGGGKMVGGDQRVLPSPRSPARGEGCSVSCPLPSHPKVGSRKEKGKEPYAVNYPPLDSCHYPSTEALFTLSSAGPGGIQNSLGPEPSLFPGPGCPPQGDSRGAQRLLTPCVMGDRETPGPGRGGGKGRAAEAGRIF